jgi:hypothetical protein
MHKFFFHTINSVSTITWTGANNGVWTTSSNWSPSIVPNSTTVGVKIANTAVTVRLDADRTINQLTFASGTTSQNLSTLTSKILTFDGNGPQLKFNTTGGVNATINTTIAIVSSLAITGSSTAQLLMPKINAVSKTITQNTAGIVSFNTTGATGITGGSYILNGGTLDVTSTALNGSSGPTITVSNTNSGTNFGGSFTNALSFSDTGTNDFTVLGNASGYSGAGVWSGNITHSLIFTSTPSTLSGTYSSLTFSGSGKVLITDPNGVGGAGGGGQLVLNTTSFPTSMPIQLGLTSSELGSPGLYNSGTTAISNTINVAISSGGGGAQLDSVSGGGAFTGSIVLNFNNAATAGGILVWGAMGGNNTISGVISNGGANVSNITMKVTTGGTLTLSNTNTYTSPTLISGSTAILNVTGSISSSSLTTITGGGTLQGSGTVSAVTSSGATTNKIKALSLVSPSVSQVLTIGGNLTETRAVTHTFQSNSSGASSRLQINGNLTASGTVVLTTATSGQTYTIANYTGTSSGVWTSAQGTITDNTGTKTITIAVP